MYVSDGPGGLVLAGPLDARSAAAVREALRDALDMTTGDVLLDVSGVESIDVIGLGVLAAAHRRAEREGRGLVLRGCQGSMRRVLAKTRMSRVLRQESERLTA